MPTRPKQHQLEDLSRAKFQLCLPSEWVLRDKDKDYGIDCEVELFDDNEKSTGFLFYVQLKATNSDNVSDIFNIDLKIETLQYFKQLEIPVLLVRYSKHLDKIYIKWVNEVDLFFAKENAKTFRIKIQETDEWTERSAKQIENDLKNARILNSGTFNFPLTYSINFNEDSIQGISNSQFKIQLRNELRKYSDFLRYKTNDENYLVDVNIEKNTLLVQTSILRGVFIHNLDKRPKEEFIEGLAQDILLSLSMCMVMVGQIDYAGKVIFDNDLENRLIIKEELLLRLLPALLSSSYFESTLNLINDALDNKENEVYLFPSIATLLLRSDTRNKKRLDLIESFFKTQLEKAVKLNIDGPIATSYYNLGNFYRGHNRFNESIHHYVQAKRYDSNYLKRPYYYSEIAGVCFLADKFLFSSKFYKKSIELGASIEAKPLLADALMFAGNYKEAINVFQDYISNIDEPNDEFLLKAILLENIVENNKITSQIRKQTEANIIAGNNPTVHDIEKALEQDLLSSLAWYNLGMIKKDESNFIDATFCFALCACINLIDVEAWTFAFLAFINSGEKGNILIGSLILKTAHWHNGDEFLLHLYEILELNSDSESSRKIITLIDNILNTDNKANEKYTVLRILNGEKYEEIKFPYYSK